MSTVVVTEFMDAPSVDALRASHEVVYDPSLVDDPARLQTLAPKAQALIVRNRTQVRGALVQALSQCRVVGRLGVGLDNIDVAACEARAMHVIAATGANALSVAEYVLATAMLLLRGIYGATRDVVAGHWPRAALSAGREICGKTLGLVGFGSIGQLTAGRARALGMEVMAYDAMMDASHPAFAAGVARCASLAEVVASADVLSLHVPLSNSTRGLFGAERLRAMKPGAVLINTSRGGIVDERALAQCLREGHLGGAALDVFEQEPLPASAHFRDCPHLLLSPHVAGLSAESNQRVSSLIASKVLEVLASKPEELPCA